MKKKGKEGGWSAVEVTMQEIREQELPPLCGCGPEGHEARAEWEVERMTWTSRHMRCRVGVAADEVPLEGWRM
eukprot:1537830-Lingulodinium_polyedra.AAC.1